MFKALGSSLSTTTTKKKKKVGQLHIWTTKRVLGDVLSPAPFKEY
jgi:hypothetical protein